MNVSDGLIDFPNAVIPVREYIRHTMVYVVAIEPTGLHVKFMPFLEVWFELWPVLVVLRKSIPFKDGSWEEARELDGHQYPTDHLLDYVGRKLRNGLYITILEVIFKKFGALGFQSPDK